ncbi:Hypothetical protein CINCED_3A005625 [Cinara cedri]|uniref:Uncharacterized protein n=1 Tax=Cinara cedri TaxID=506608 RepID=A0A5E4N0S4_9HEMI|nr:Hypothetical protein CINCED_3A005625 [Cinara cedri]
MENCRDISIRQFKLNPVHYYTTPDFAWNVMLRKRLVELELLRYIDKYLMFEQDLDANNLYGWAMSKYLPYKGFKLCNPDLFNTEKILRMKDDQEKGYI